MKNINMLFKELETSMSLGSDHDLEKIKKILNSIITNDEFKFLHDETETHSFKQSIVELTGDNFRSVSASIINSYESRSTDHSNNIIRESMLDKNFYNPDNPYKL